MSLHNSRTEIDQLAVVDSTVSQACAIQGTSQQSEVMDQRHVVVPNLASLLTYCSCILYSLPQELRDEIYKYAFEPRVEIRNTKNRYGCRHPKFSTDHFSLAYKSTVVCALLPVSRSIYKEVWRLLVPARDQFTSLFDAMMKSKSWESAPRVPISWEHAPLVAAFGPRIRYVCESSDDHEFLYDKFWGVDNYLPESLIVLIDEYVVVGEAVAGSMGSAVPDFHVNAWYDELRSLLNLRTFNIQVPETRPYFTPRFATALQVGKMLLDEKSVKTVHLLFRKKVQASTWQEILGVFIGDVLDTEDVKTTSQGELKSLMRRFDAQETQPWAFENDVPWFSDSCSMKQVIRITRYKDTQLGPSTHDSRTEISCDLHSTNQKLMK